MGGSRVCIIAEAGVNHNGSLDNALRMVDVAAASGVDMVKFQTFRAETLVTRTAPKADYQRRATGAAESQYDMLRRLELDEAAHRALIGRCRAAGVGFLSTPFDIATTAYLVADLRLPTLKISSGDLTNGPMLLAAARAGCEIILSTGMATLAEVEEALGVLAFGYLGGGEASSAAFAAAWRSDEGRRRVRERVTLLHCTTEYPAPYGEVNLRAMATLADAFGTKVGYSDHTPGIAVAVAAVALGAVVVEKHFTLDRGQSGPDHAASLEPRELKELAAAVRAIEAALGSPAKEPTPSERKNMAVARKSLVAARPIGKGDLLNADDLAAKRPGTGISPMRLWDLVGRPAGRDYAVDEPLEW